MAELVLKIDESIREALRVPFEEQKMRLYRELALRLYSKGLLSFGKARELAQMSKWEFWELLAQEGIERHYDLEELETDLETLEASGEGSS